MKGYFTVEAVMVFPVVLMVYFFLIYVGFYQYDRCLMEQDLRRALLAGSRMTQSGAEEILAETRLLFEKMRQDKYLIWEMEELYFESGKGKISGRAEAVMHAPVAAWSGTGLGTVWKFEAHGERAKMDPVLWIRTWDRLRKELENGESGKSESSVSADGGTLGQ